MQQQNDYIQCFNRVIDFIRDHITEDLSLDRLAEVAGFSPFHFHRIFSSLIGETVNQFVVRLRLERAVTLLKASPQCPIQRVAFDTGFQSLSNFSRTFKKRYGISASKWDRITPLKERKNGQIIEGFPFYTETMLQAFEDTGEFRVELQDLPEQRIAYVRVQNAYELERSIAGYNQLMDWYFNKGGHMEHTLLYGMSQDDPEITPLKHCRFDWCLRIPEHWQVDGAVSERTLPACTVAKIDCQGEIYLIDRAWQYLFKHWLPNSRFKPANLPAMEIYRRQPVEIGWERYDLACSISIVSW